MTSIRDRWSRIVVCSAFAALLTVLAPVHGAVRSITVLWFLLVCPGLAFVRLLCLHDVLAESVLTIALSLAISGTASGALMYARLWTPTRALLLVTAITLGAAAVPVPARQRERSEQRRP